MKAMVLAAGLGTRLRPLTDDRPKALVTVAGHTMLEIVLARLRDFGVNEVIINTHHFADMVHDYLEANHNFGMRIEISHEEQLLDTGGGLKKAAWFFLKSAGKKEEPFILHNVDIISTIDIARLLEFHREQRALSTFAVQNRETSRYLLFDDQSILCGRRAGRNGELDLVRPVETPRAFAFSCIHVVSPQIFAMMTEEGAFSIIDEYLRFAAQGEKIAGFRADDYYWRDLGKPESIAAAERDIASGALEQ
jgi:NDP-sugar pyrophosphorylase family protein